MSTSLVRKIKGRCFASIVSFLKIKKITKMNSKSIDFIKTGHHGTQDRSTTQVSSQTPIETILRTSEAGKIEVGCFRSIVSILKVKQSSLMILK